MQATEEKPPIEDRPRPHRRSQRNPRDGIACRPVTIGDDAIVDPDHGAVVDTHLVDCPQRFASIGAQYLPVGTTGHDLARETGQRGPRRETPAKDRDEKAVPVGAGAEVLPAIDQDERLPCEGDGEALRGCAVEAAAQLYFINRIVSCSGARGACGSRRD